MDAAYSYAYIFVYIYDRRIQYYLFLNFTKNKILELVFLTNI